MSGAEQKGLKSRSVKGDYQLWAYRCYHIKPKHGTWRCTNVLRGITLDFPDSFVWTAYGDRTGLKKFIDCLLRGEKVEVERYEKAGVVTEVIPNEKHDTPYVHISLDRMLEVLSMRDTLRVPLYGRVGLCTSRDGSNRFIAKDAYLIMAKYGAILPGVPSDWSPENVVGINDKTIERLGLDENHMHSGAHLDGEDSSPTPTPAGEAAPVGQAPVVSSKQPKEVERLRRYVKDNVIELFTEVHPDGAKPFFVRRLISSDGELLFSASSFSAEGPWKEFTRNSSALLALGIDC